MARFPSSSDVRARVYTLDLPEGAPMYDAPLSNLRRYFDAQIGEGCMDGILFRSRVPPSLEFQKEELWGWCYLDDENPVSVGPWLVWGIRGWKKRPPPRLLSALVEQRCKAWCKDNARERCPSSVRREIKENARTELLVQTPPEVGDAAVLLDIQRRRLFLPHLSEAQARGIRLRIMPILRQIIHPEVILVDWDLDTYLAETRPAAALPSEVGDRWLAFLTEQASRDTWAVFRNVPEHDEPVVFQLSLDGQVKLATDETDTIRADGEEAVRDALRWVGDEARVRVREVNLMITEPEPSNRQIALRLDNTGAVKAAKVIGGDLWADDEAELEAAVFERAETMTEVAVIVRLLMHAFDAGPLEKMLTEARQALLWPGHVAPQVEWFDELPSPAALGLTAPTIGGPDERLRRRTDAYRAGIEAYGDDEAARAAHEHRTSLSEAFRALWGDGRTSVTFGRAGQEAVVVHLGSELRDVLVELWRQGDRGLAIAKYRDFANCSEDTARARVEEVAEAAGLSTAPIMHPPDEEAQPRREARGGSVKVTAQDAAAGAATLARPAYCAARHPTTGLKCDAGAREHKQHGCANPDEPGKRLRWSA